MKIMIDKAVKMLDIQLFNKKNLVIHLDNVVYEKYLVYEK